MNILLAPLFVVAMVAMHIVSLIWAILMLPITILRCRTWFVAVSCCNETSDGQGLWVNHLKIGEIAENLAPAAGYREAMLSAAERVRGRDSREIHTHRI